MAERKSLLELLRKIIADETRFLRHYNGEVVDNADPNKLGRLKVKIPVLGWTDAQANPWCYPRQLNGMVIPKVGQWVDVYFPEGVRDNPCWLATVNEIPGNVPASYKDRRQVLFEDMDSGDEVGYDKNTGVLELMGGAEYASMGETLKTWLTNFINLTFNTHAHGAAGTPPVTPAVPPNDTILAKKVKVK